jgi:hypothetical protein
MALVVLGAASLTACVNSPTKITAAAGQLSGKTEIPMLVAAGKVAKWKLCCLDFDDGEKPSYRIAWENPSRLEGQYSLDIRAARTCPKIPKTTDPGDDRGVAVPIKLTQEIFIPALGRKVHYYCKSEATGSENAIFSTEPIAWPDGHGGQVFYEISAESDAPEKILNQVKWSAPGSMADTKLPDDGTIRL